jgi:ABC-type spermidine/putrescine transport system permease subunit II
LKKVFKVILKILRIIVCIALAILAAIWAVSFTIRTFATFEMEMLPKLIIPIIIVAIPAYIIIYNLLGHLYHLFFGDEWWKK